MKDILVKNTDNNIYLIGCAICNNAIHEDSQFINGKWYHNKCIVKQLQEIERLKEDIKELQDENEKLTTLWLKSQEKRRKAVEYLKQPNRDNFDFSKARLLEILD